MSTTATGVVYTEEYSTTSDGGACRWYMRDDRKDTLDQVPLLLFVHGGGGNVDSFGFSGWVWLREALINAGWAVVEGDGGGPSNWGGPTAQGLYLEMFDWVSTKIIPGVLVIMGQSMGGIAAYNLAGQSILESRHSALIIENGTTDLTQRYSDHARAAYPAMNAAYGVPGATYQPELFDPAAQPYDPMQFPESMWAGKNVRQVWGAQDDSVEPGPHGQAWVTKYGTSTMSTSVFINDPGGHNPLKADQLSTFDYMQALLPPRPPLPERVYTVRRLNMIT